MPSIGVPYTPTAGASIHETRGTGTRCSCSAGQRRGETLTFPLQQLLRWATAARGAYPEATEAAGVCSSVSTRRSRNGTLFEAREACILYAYGRRAVWSGVSCLVHAAAGLLATHVFDKLMEAGLLSCKSIVWCTEPQGCWCVYCVC